VTKAGVSFHLLNLILPPTLLILQKEKKLKTKKVSQTSPVVLINSMLLIFRIFPKFPSQIKIIVTHPLLKNILGLIAGFAMCMIVNIFMLQKASPTITTLSYYKNILFFITIVRHLAKPFTC
jgi:hypothetical protein